MRADRPLRLPLQIGTSALTSLTLSAAFFAPGSILVGVPATVLIALDITDIGDAAAYIFFPGLFVCGLAWKHLVRARAQRPSDLLLTREGFEIRGGPHHLTQLKWSELSKVTLEVPAKKQSQEEDESDLKQLCVYRGQERLQLAAADQASEQHSLTELARTLQAGRGTLPEHQKRTAAKDDATALVVCPSCAAAVGPADAPSVTCPYCQAKVPVSEDVRRKLRDSADVARRPDASVAKLLDQPGAGFLSGLLAVAAVFMLAAWPTALVLGTLEFFQNTLTLKGTGFLLLFFGACVLGFFGLLRGRLVDRQALRLVALDFGAIPPHVAGQPSLCRRCLAPLSAGAAQVLVSCVYCQTDNVLGIDLRRDARVAREETKSLTQALQRRTHERRRWRGVSLAGVALLGLSGYSLRSGLGRNEKTWALEQQCDQADLTACVALADLLSDRTATDVQVDVKRAMRLYQRGCDQHLAGACVKLAARYLERTSANYDLQRARQLQARACELGAVDACGSPAQ